MGRARRVWQREIELDVCLQSIYHISQTNVVDEAMASDSRTDQDGNTHPGGVNR